MIGIYKITNNITNQSYIGQSIHIEQRWKEHKQEAKTGNSQAKIYQAIRCYGIENFSFSVLEECELDENILNNREKYWILYYDSFNNGYNMTTGGQGTDSWIYNPDIFKKLWDEGYSTQQIANIVKCSMQLVANRLQGYKDFGTSTGHARSYYSQTNIHICQYSLLGDFIKEYTSIREAERDLKISHSNVISLCLNNKLKTGYGFQWKNYKQEKIEPIASAHGKLVQCIETGELFPNTESAALKYGLASRHNIIRACNTSRSAGKNPITGEKLHWKYIE